MTRVPLSDLLKGLEFASAGDGESAACVCLATGRVFFQSDWTDDEEELPADLDDPAHYLALPTRRELDLGRELVMAFIEDASPADVETVRSYFRQRGAYGRYKDLLARRELLDSWYAFEQTATESALSEWCAQNGLQPT